jgi:hypothetical protein
LHSLMVGSNWFELVMTTTLSFLSGPLLAR